jgi:hypothetical protein
MLSTYIIEPPLPRSSQKSCLTDRQIYAKLNRFRICQKKERTGFLSLSSKIEPSSFPSDKDGNLYFQHDVIACPSERMPSKGKPLHEGLSSPILVTAQSPHRKTSEKALTFTSPSDWIEDQVYVVDQGLFKESLDDHRLHAQEFIKQFPARLALAKALNEAIHEQLRAKSPTKTKESYSFEIGDPVWLSTPLRTQNAKKKTKADDDDDDGSLIAKFMFRRAGPMQIVSKSDDRLQYVVIKQLSKNAIIARVTHVNSLRLFTPTCHQVRPLTRQEKTAAAVHTDSFEEEVQAWKRLVSLSVQPQRLPSASKRNYFEGLITIPENKQYYIEKLDSHEFDSKKQEFIYRVKWLGYAPHCDLMLPERDSALCCGRILGMLAQIHDNQCKEMSQRRTFTNKYQQKATDQIITPSENNTWDDNERLDPSSPPEKLQPHEYHVPFETSLNPSKCPVWTSH